MSDNDKLRNFRVRLLSIFSFRSRTHVRDSTNEARAGWKALFTGIVASNEEIKRFLNMQATILMSMVFS